MNDKTTLIDAVLKNMGIELLNEMQQTTLAAYANQNDILLLSPTGSGKTLAFLLPLYANMKPEISGVQALIIAPTRELVQQIEQVWRSMGTGFRVLSCYGGRPSNSEKHELAKAPALLIGTPGRLQDHVEREISPLNQSEHLCSTNSTSRSKWDLPSQWKPLSAAFHNSKNAY